VDEKQRQQKKKRELSRGSGEAVKEFLPDCGIGRVEVEENREVWSIKRMGWVN
jgi:hypothetical protein